MSAASLTHVTRSVIFIFLTFRVINAAPVDDKKSLGNEPESPEEMAQIFDTEQKNVNENTARDTVASKEKSATEQNRVLEQSKAPRAHVVALPTNKTDAIQNEKQLEVKTVGDDQKQPKSPDMTSGGNTGNELPNAAAGPVKEDEKADEAKKTDEVKTDWSNKFIDENVQNARDKMKQIMANKTITTPADGGQPHSNDKNSVQSTSTSTSRSTTTTTSQQKTRPVQPELKKPADEDGVNADTDYDDTEPVQEENDTNANQKPDTAPSDGVGKEQLQPPDTQPDSGVPVVNRVNEQRELSKIDFNQSASSHFMTYMVTFAVFVAVAYILFHNKQKIVGLIVEGRLRPPAGGRRGGSSARYHRLDSRLKDGDDLFYIPMQTKMAVKTPLKESDRRHVIY